MAEKTIGDLTAASTLDGTEKIELEQSGNSRRSTVDDALALMFSTVDDVFASRTHSTWYQNTTGRPMDVGIRIAVSSARTAYLSPDNGTTTYRIAYWAKSLNSMLHFIVPAGWYYQIDGTGATDWIEVY